MERLTSEQAEHIGELARKAKKNQRLTNKQIGDSCKPQKKNEATVRDVLRGHCHVRETVTCVCQALGIDLVAALSSMSRNEGPDFGGYTEKDCENLIGVYTTVRTVYADRALLKCYQTELRWNESHNCLEFEESNRYDKDEKRGHIYMRRSSSFIYLMTVTKGWVRTVVVSQILDSTATMRGLILSQYEVSGGNFSPVVAPIIYEKQKPGDAPPVYGEIGSTDDRFPRYLQLLSDALEKGYGKMAFPSSVVFPASQ